MFLHVTRYQICPFWAIFEKTHSILYCSCQEKVTRSTWITHHTLHGCAPRQSSYDPLGINRYSGPIESSRQGVVTIWLYYITAIFSVINRASVESFINSGHTENFRGSCHQFCLLFFIIWKFDQGWSGKVFQSKLSSSQLSFVSPVLLLHLSCKRKSCHAFTEITGHLSSLSTFLLKGKSLHCTRSLDFP